jgi:hypothetical protein
MWRRAQPWQHYQAASKFPQIRAMGGV